MNNIRIFCLFLCMTALSGCIETPRTSLDVQHPMAQTRPINASFAILPQAEEHLRANVVIGLRSALTQAGMEEVSEAEADYLIIPWLTVAHSVSHAPDTAPLPEISIDPVSNTPVLREGRTHASAFLRHAVLSVIIVEGPPWRSGEQYIVYKAQATTPLYNNNPADTVADVLINAMFSDFAADDDAANPAMPE